MGRDDLHCRHCGFGVPTEAPVCPGCRRPAIDDWRARARAVRAHDGRNVRPEPPLHDEGYRSLLDRAGLARATLWLTAVVAVATTAAHLLWIVRLDDPTVVVGSTAIDVERISRAATTTLLGLLAVTGIAFVAWAVRAYRNLPALGIRERRYWTVWLVIGWVIPGANLFVPKLLVDDLWRASSPSAAVDGGDEWQRRPVASIVNQWWWSFLVTPAVVVLAVVTAQGGLAEAGERATTGTLVATAAAALLIASVAARRLVAVVTVAQARRADVVVDVRSSAEHLRGLALPRP